MPLQKIDPAFDEWAFVIIIICPAKIYAPRSVLCQILLKMYLDADSSYLGRIWIQIQILSVEKYSDTDTNICIFQLEDTSTFLVVISANFQGKNVKFREIVSQFKSWNTKTILVGEKLAKKYLKYQIQDTCQNAYLDADTDIFNFDAFWCRYKICILYFRYISEILVSPIQHKSDIY